MSNELGFTLYGIGAIISLIGFLWLLIRAFGVSTLWGVVVLLFGFPAIFFAIVHRKKGLVPLLVILLGGLICGVAFSWNSVFPPKIDDKAKIEIKPDNGTPPTNKAFSQITGGKVTLTGAARPEYGRLQEDKTFAVIQWANLDVTDDDAKILAEMKNLKEIDLSNSQITDETAKILQALPTLEIVKIAKTKISPGAAQKLLELPVLREVDFRNLKVPTAVLREWKAKDKDTRKYIN